MTRSSTRVLVFAAAVLIGGCGQKRDLVLPETPPETEPPKALESDDGQVEIKSENL